MRNYNKLNFSESQNAHGDHGSVGHSQCHNYGSISGCDEYCPALWDGECTEIKEVLKKIFSDESDIIELNELRDIYNLQEIK